MSDPLKYVVINYYIDI